MSVRWDESDLLSLPEAARALPGNVNPATVWRWATRGRNGVRLGTLKIGRGRYTTRRELQRFLVASDSSSVVAQSTMATVQMTHDEAADYLASEGI